MKIHYTPRDYWHYLRMAHRNRLRQKYWGKRFEAALLNKSYTIPHAPMVQIIPTEACNLRCLMCNQWGETGYLPNGARQVQHMDKDGLTALMRSLSPRDTLLSIHGGEPFVYKHIDLLLELTQEKRMDVIISTNGTLLEEHLAPLGRIENLVILLSVDGDRETHDKIRGQGRFEQLKKGLAALFQWRRRRGMPLPMVIMNFVVCEWNTGIIEKTRAVARELGVFVLNLNMRWFVTEEVGASYEAHLLEYFRIKSCGAWRGLISRHSDHDYKPACAALRALREKKNLFVFPPYIAVTPTQLRGRNFETYFSGSENVFGCESCFMPFYWARIHSNGDLVYCPGNPDIIAGNVLESGLTEALNSGISVQFRKHILHHRLPICSRCCGLYVNTAARPYEQKVRRKLGLEAI